MSSRLVESVHRWIEQHLGWYDSERARRQRLESERRLQRARAIRVSLGEIKRRPGALDSYRRLRGIR